MAEITEMEMVEKYQRFSLQLENVSSMLLPPLNDKDSDLIKSMMRVGALHFLKESGFISTRMFLALLAFEIEQFEIFNSSYQEERK